mgnify:CR=1 FL=1
MRNRSSYFYLLARPAFADEAKTPETSSQPTEILAPAQETAVTNVEVKAPTTNPISTNTELPTSTSTVLSEAPSSEVASSELASESPVEITSEQELAIKIIRQIKLYLLKRQLQKPLPQRLHQKKSLNLFLSKKQKHLQKTVNNLPQSMKMKSQSHLL